VVPLSRGEELRDLEGACWARGRALDLAQRRVTRKLAELQRDPGVRMVSALALSVLRADKGRAGATSDRKEARGAETFHSFGRVGCTASGVTSH
jgi:hypothetical protein